MSAEYPSRKVRMSPELMEQWATRDAQGRLLRWDWGEPDEEGFYTPSITTVDDGARLVTAETLRPIKVKAAALRERAQRTAISAEDWRYSNGYSECLSAILGSLDP